jgi:hypothetical protein
LNNQNDELEKSLIKEDDSDALIDNYVQLEPKVIDTLNFPFLLKPNGKYNEIKLAVKAKKLIISQLYRSAKDSIRKKQILDSARNYITDALINQLIPHWYGMPWSFFWLFSSSSKREVGCSYFVSNTLLHAGFNVNRYKLAQQGL